MTEANGNGNANGNANGSAGAAISVSAAAERLGMTLPRLQRILKRPEFAEHVWRGPLQTKTGIRMATLVSPALLAALQQDASLPRVQPESRLPETSHSEMGELEKRDMLAALVRTKDAEIAEKERHLRTKDALIAEKEAHIVLLTEKAAALEQRLATIAQPAPAPKSEPLKFELVKPQSSKSQSAKPPPEVWRVGAKKLTLWERLWRRY